MSCTDVGMQGIHHRDERGDVGVALAIPHHPITQRQGHRRLDRVVQRFLTAGGRYAPPGSGTSHRMNAV